MGENLVQPYWYGAQSPERAVLEAIRELGRADLAMRRVMAGGMDMGVTDMRALQIVIAGERRGVRVTAAQLATGLGITTASTAKLLNRLEASGHVQRVKNKADARSVCIAATDHAHQEVKDRLGVMHDRMRAVTHSYSEQELLTIASFLGAMTEVFKTSGEAPPSA